MFSETRQLLLYTIFACGLPILFAIIVYFTAVKFFETLPDYLQDFGTQPGFIKRNLFNYRKPHPLCHLRNSFILIHNFSGFIKFATLFLSFTARNYICHKYIAVRFDGVENLSRQEKYQQNFITRWKSTSSRTCESKFW